jgi:hypothetical protein
MLMPYRRDNLSSLDACVSRTQLPGLALSSVHVRSSMRYRLSYTHERARVVRRFARACARCSDWKCDRARGGLEMGHCDRLHHRLIGIETTRDAARPRAIEQ